MSKRKLKYIGIISVVAAMLLNGVGISYAAIRNYRDLDRQILLADGEGTGSESEEPETPEPETPEPETPEPETPEPETPGTETPGTETPGTETPGTETPGTETPGTETPGTETPGTETPGTETPGTETPGTGDDKPTPKPDPNPKPKPSETSYTVKFDTRGGDKIDSKDVKEGNRVSEPSKPKRKGYKFEGWYTDTDFKSRDEYDFKDAVTKSFTLYAKWEEDKDSIEIDFYVYDNRNGRLREESRYSVDKKDKIMSISEDILKGKTAEESRDKDKDKRKDEIKYSTSGGSFTEIDGIKNNNEYTWILYVNGKEVKKEDVAKQELKDRDKIEWKYEYTYKAPTVTVAKTTSMLNKSSNMAYISGYSDETFRPNDKISREEVASIIDKLLTPEARAKSKKNSNFKDVSGWSKDAIETLSGLGIINGYSDGSFRPKGSISRGEVAIILFRVNELDKVSGNKFNDTSAYAGRDEINAVAKEGWISGYDDGTFRPNQKISRAEFVTMMNKSLGRTGRSNKANPFKDVEPASWYYEEVLRAL